MKLRADLCFIFDLGDMTGRQLTCGCASLALVLGTLCVFVSFASSNVHVNTKSYGGEYSTREGSFPQLLRGTQFGGWAVDLFHFNGQRNPGVSEWNEEGVTHRWLFGVPESKDPSEQRPTGRMYELPTHAVGTEVLAGFDPIVKQDGAC